MLAGAAAFAAALAGYGTERAWQLSQSSQDPLLPAETGSRASPHAGEAFARLSIPRIGLKVTVIEGTRKRDLLRAPGHLAGSAAPGDPDNCIIAGHRDIHFRRLGRVVVGDLIELEAGNRKVRYRVQAVRVVLSGDTSVLASTKEPILTLITCYPFRYVGSAPQRYVVRALMADGPAAAL